MVVDEKYIWRHKEIANTIVSLYNYILYYGELCFAEIYPAYLRMTLIFTDFPT